MKTKKVSAAKRMADLFHRNSGVAHNSSAHTTFTCSPHMQSANYKYVFAAPLAALWFTTVIENVLMDL